MSIEQKSSINELGKIYLPDLTQKNPEMSPIGLSQIFPSYEPFIPHRKSLGLWTTTEHLQAIQSEYFKNNKVMLLISGIAAGGKDAIRETIEEVNPEFLFKLVTATSRDIREGEEHGVDYYFYSRDEFLASVNRDEFVEYVLQGNRLYGLPKVSLTDALEGNAKVICSHVEMSAWPKVEDVLRDYPDVFTLKVFVMPLMPFAEYAQKWLPQRRKDVDTRLIRTAGELSMAPSRAHIIVSNHIAESGTSLEWESKAISNYATMLLSMENEGLRLFDTPFDISPGVEGRSPVLDYHKALVRRN